MINVNHKAISKVVIYYTDGTYQEVSNTYTAPSPPVYPFMPPSYPPGYPPAWTSPFTYGVNEVTCGTGWGVTNTKSKVYKPKDKNKRVSSYFYAMGV